MYIRLFCFILATFSSSLFAEPVVLYDGENAIPAYPYKQLVSDDVPDFGAIWAEENKVTEESNNTPASILPIRTTLLTPGKVTSREVTFNSLFSPICIIGSDNRSINWIKKYQKPLLENKALCWLVSAETADDVQRVIRALKGIQMTPSDGDKLAKFFNISHYPVLITARFIEQ